MMPYKLVRRQLRELRYPMVVFSEPPSVWSDFRARWQSYHQANYPWIWSGAGIALGVVIGLLLP